MGALGVVRTLVKHDWGIKEFVIERLGIVDTVVLDCVSV